MKIEKYIPRSGILESSLDYAYRNFIPLVTTLEITQVCNFKCHHCYNFDRNKHTNHPEIGQSLSTNEILNLIPDLSELGVLFLNLSGGEALTHPDINLIIAHARSFNMEVRLKSNGALLTEDKIKQLENAGLNGIDLSLYGLSEESYYKLTQNKNSFNLVMNSLSLLKKSKINIHISIILHRYNVEELEKMISYCEEHQFYYQISSEVTKRYDGSSDSRDFEMTNEQFSTLLNSKYAHFFESCDNTGKYQCSCARSVCGISFNGDVFPCIGAPIISGNIRKDSIKEIWKNSPRLNEIRNLKQSDFKECVTCEVQDNCSRSSGSIFINTGNYTGCESKTKEQAKIVFDHLKSRNL